MPRASVVEWLVIRKGVQERQLMSKERVEGWAGGTAGVVRVGKDGRRDMIGERRGGRSGRL